MRKILLIVIVLMPILSNAQKIKTTTVKNFSAGNFSILKQEIVGEKIITYTLTAINPNYRNIKKHSIMPLGSLDEAIRHINKMLDFITNEEAGVSEIINIAGEDYMFMKSKLLGGNVLNISKGETNLNDMQLDTARIKNFLKTLEKEVK